MRVEKRAAPWQVMNEKVLGPDHIQMATTYHAMAVAMSIIGLYSLSVKHETKTLEILRTKLGDSDQRSQESLVWLNYFRSAWSHFGRRCHQPLCAICRACCGRV